MKKNLKKILIMALLLPASAYASNWHWAHLWQTADQRAYHLLQSGDAKTAAKLFTNSDWRAVANYRSTDYKQAFQDFRSAKTSDNQYNAGNAAAQLGRYQEAITAYDQSIALNPNNTDAIFNRDIIKKLLKEKQQASNSSPNKKSSQQQNSKQENSSSQQNKDQQSAANQQQSASYQQSPTKHTPQNQSTNKNLQSSDNKPTEKPTADNSHTEELKSHEENKQQLLRRVVDDPGGLLRQKFLRDYYRRHGMAENLEQGAS